MSRIPKLQRHSGHSCFTWNEDRREGGKVLRREGEKELRREGEKELRS